MTNLLDACDQVVSRLAGKNTRLENGRYTFPLDRFDPQPDQESFQRLLRIIMDVAGFKAAEVCVDDHTCTIIPHDSGLEQPRARERLLPAFNRFRNALRNFKEIEQSEFIYCPHPGAPDIKPILTALGVPFYHVRLMHEITGETPHDTVAVDRQVYEAKIAPLLETPQIAIAV